MGKKANANFFKATRTIAILKNKRYALSQTNYWQQWQSMANELLQIDPMANKDWLESILEIQNSS